MVCVSRAWVEESAVRPRSSVMPTTPFIGVRSSWLMRARKSLLACAASASCRLLSTSSRVRSVDLGLQSLLALHDARGSSRGAPCTR